MDIDIVTRIYFFIGAGIVFFFAVNYFNQPGYKFADEDKSLGVDQDDLMLEPALPKYLTDRFEYVLYLSAYILVTELIYVLLVLFLPDLISSDINSTAAPLLPTRQNIVLSALIITGIAPNLPYVRKLLEHSKLYLHLKAQIPRKGRDVYRQIKSYKPFYTRAEIKNIVNDSRYQESSNGGKARPDLTESDFKLEAWTLVGRWAKLSYLLSYISKWSRAIPFQSYIGNKELQHESILKAYDYLQKQMVLFRRDGLSDQDKARLNAHVDATLNRTYRLISCLLYLAGKTDAAVDNYLDQLGYAPSEREDFPIPWNNVVYVLAAIVGSIIAGGLMSVIVTKYQLLPFDVTFNTQNIRICCGYALPFLTIPVLWVLFLKQYLSTYSEAWPVITENNRYQKAADRPWHLYVIVAFAAYAVGWLTIMLTVTLVGKDSTGQPIGDFGTLLRPISVWTIVVFVTALFAAYRIDSAPNLNRPKAVTLPRRLLGALFQGIATVIVIVFAFLDSHGSDPEAVSESTEGTLAIYCVIGFFLGALLHMASGFGRLRQRRKSWRRRTRRRIFLNTDLGQINGYTVNISKDGALVQSDEALREKTDIRVSADQSDDAAPAHIVKTRGNYVHIRFPNVDAWKLVQGNLEIPALA